VFGINLAALAFLGPVDRARHAIERMDPVAYLSTTYSSIGSWASRC
jgi:hypothetical protein